MTNQEKRQAALHLLELRGSFGAPRNLPPGHPLLSQLEKMRGVMAELYSEHFSDQQLQAQLDFYESDLGKSIVETEFKFQEHFVERMNEEASKQSSASPALMSAISMPRFSEHEAYLAMYLFLANRQEDGPSDEIRALLSKLSPLPNGEFADPAMFQEWKEVLRAVRAAKVDARR
jgi:hypothetical protein